MRCPGHMTPIHDPDCWSLMPDFDWRDCNCTLRDRSRCKVCGGVPEATT